MRRPILVAAISIMLVLSGNGFSQSSSASLSGTVSDAAKALIPGVTITATNVETGVISTGLTN
jgi:hypothetical protein